MQHERRRRGAGLCPVAQAHPWHALLREELLALEAGAVVTLDVAGTVGTWAKMAAGKNGAPTPGLRALGQARIHGLFRFDRGVVVPIRKP
jgi:hypothetical protein